MVSPSTREREAAAKPIENPNQKVFIRWWDNLKHRLGLMSDTEFDQKYRRDSRLRIFAARNLHRVKMDRSTVRRIRKDFKRLSSFK